MTALLAGQVVATLALSGLVWFVQVVHYPLFARVEPGSFARTNESTLSAPRGSWRRS